MTPEQRFAELGLELPAPPEPIGVYRPFLQIGNHVYVSGHGAEIVGKAGRELDRETAKRAARETGLLILSTLRANLGSLDRIGRVIKVLGMVNAVEDFGEHPYVINGCSELFAHVWGRDQGIGVRSAVGMGSLPGGIAVEIEAMFELFV